MRSVFVLCGLLSLASAAGAVDGVIEINQARATAGAINGSLASDPAGFPIVITAPGSYRLTSDLVPVQANVTAIQVNASNVTVDLNDFSIRGPWVTGASCGAAGGGVGIFADATRAGIFVRNGRVSGMNIHGVATLGAGARVERVASLSNCVTGIFVGDYSRVSDSQAIGNFSGHGIVTGKGSVVAGSIASENGLFGILGNGAGVIVTDSTTMGNKDSGISADGGIVARSLSQGNGTTIGTSLGNPGDQGIIGDLVFESVSNANTGLPVSADGVAYTVMESDTAPDFSAYKLGCVLFRGGTYCPDP